MTVEKIDVDYELLKIKAEAWDNLINDFIMTDIDDTLHKGSVRVFKDEEDETQHLLKGWDGYQWVFIYNYNQPINERNDSYAAFTTKYSKRINQ